MLPGGTLWSEPSWLELPLSEKGGSEQRFPKRWAEFTAKVVAKAPADVRIRKPRDTMWELNSQSIFRRTTPEVP